METFYILGKFKTNAIGLHENKNMDKYSYVYITKTNMQAGFYSNFFV